ncbi:tyrosine-type recombinase/integrase [Streptomyces sp. NPDC054904]
MVPPWTPQTAPTSFRPAFHDLRHLAATITITAGVPLPVVSKTLRHSTLSTTANIYSHLTQQAAREAVETIDHTLTQAQKRNDRRAWLDRLRPPRDHLQHLREALNRLRSPTATTSIPGMEKAALSRMRERPPTCVNAGRDDRI